MSPTLLYKPIVLGLVMAMSWIATKAADSDFDSEASDLVAQMTLEEKIGMVSGVNYMEMPGIQRLGIPQIRLSNGPHGARPWKTPNYAYGVTDEYRKATCFPAGINMAASFDPELIYEVGRAIGREANAKGVSIIAGPCVNIVRNPYGGRNFESYGEDPHLAAEMSVRFVQGVQKEGVMATVKHFVANNQDYNRFEQDLTISERALREVYFPAYYETWKRGNVASFMTAYPQVNGAYCSENHWLLEKVLKGEWGFDGFVMSDWWAAKSSLPSFLGGLDIEMPAGDYFAPEFILSSLKSGDLTVAQLDEKIHRRLKTMMRFGLFEPDRPLNQEYDTPRHRELTRTIAEAGMVLLKNEGALLPLKASELKRVAVIGPSAIILRMGGGGSSTIPPRYTVSPLEGIQAHLPPSCQVDYAQGFSMKGDVFPIEPAHFSHGLSQPGLRAEYFANTEFSGRPAVTRVDRRLVFDWGEETLEGGLKNGNYSVRWTGFLTPSKSGKYIIHSVFNGGPMEVKLDGKWITGDRQHQEDQDADALAAMLENELAHARSDTALVNLEGGRAYPIEVRYASTGWKSAAVLGWQVYDPDPAERARAIARDADVVLFFCGISHDYESEGWDLRTIHLDPAQVELLREIVRINPRTVAIMHNGTPLLVSEWVDDVPALLEAWYPGQEGGNAIARVLLGEVNPSGKLPVTFPRKWEDCPASSTYPPADEKTIVYEDDIFVGYRHYDTRVIEPSFPFGFGLSYTTFNFSDLNVSNKRLQQGESLELSLAVTNTGSMAGAEVVQLYLHDRKASRERPVQELKGFRKVFLEPGETRQVTFTVDEADLSFWHDGKRSFVAEPGDFEIRIGTSSRDIRLAQTFRYE